jgi:hypothetical protein
MTEIEELRARIDVLEAHNAGLRRAVDELMPASSAFDASSSAEPRRPVSRRRLLGAGVGAMAAGVAAVVTAPAVVSAHDTDDVRLGGDNPAVTKRTLLVIANTSTADAFVGLTRNAGTGVVGQNTVGGTGVKGYAGDGAPPSPDYPAGVVGISTNGLNGVFGSGSTGVLGTGPTGVHGGGTDVGVYGTSIATGTGVYGLAGSAGVVGETNDDKVGVHGIGHAGTGVTGEGRVGLSGVGDHIGVKGQASSSAGEHYGVLGVSLSPKGRGVFGHSTSSTSGAGVWGSADSPTGVGVRGVGFNGGQGAAFGTGVLGASGSAGADTAPGRPNTGVVGIGYGSDGTGVYGSGVRGAVVQGTAAPLQLVPSQLNSHPSSGQLGDLFVDATGRLFFCKGDTTWVKLA